jgi:threonine dehydrogenase-like Zn-dependent dehydrogenase
MNTMTAVVFRGVDDIQVEEVARPRPRPGEAVIRITATTICGTDVHIVKGEYPVRSGLILGHEPVGVIHELGEGLENEYQRGQRVIVGANRAVRTVFLLPEWCSFAVLRPPRLMAVWQTARDGAAVRPGGTMSSLGVYSGKLVAPYEAIQAGLGDQRIVTTLCPGGKERMRRLMSMVRRGRVDLTPLVTHQFTLDQLPEAFELFSRQADGVMKVAIHPGGGAKTVGALREPAAVRS